MTTVTPIQQQNKSTTGRDIAISTGVGLLGGATGVAAGYNMKPTANQYAKALIKDNLESVDRYKSFVDGIAGLKPESRQERKQILKAFKHMEEFLNNPREFFKRLEYDFISSYIKDAETPRVRLSNNSSTSFKDFLINLISGKKDKRTSEEIANNIKEILEERAGTIKSKEFKEAVIDRFKNLDNDAKNALKPLVRGSNMMKWGIIGAGVASLMTAYLLCFAKDRDDNYQSEVTEQV